MRRDKINTEKQQHNFIKIAFDEILRIQRLTNPTVQKGGCDKISNFRANPGVCSLLLETSEPEFVDKTFIPRSKESSSNLDWALTFFLFSFFFFP